MRNRFCCLCIATEVRIHEFVNSESKRFIENIFKENSLHQSFYEYEYICYECKALLEKTFQFVKKTLAAQQILCNLYKDSNEVTLDQIKAIDRKKISLSTNLTNHELYNIDCYVPEDKKCIPKINENDSPPAVKDELHEVEFDIKIEGFNIDDPLDSKQNHNESVVIKKEDDALSDISLNGLHKDEEIDEPKSPDTKGKELYLSIDEFTLKEDSSNNLPDDTTFNRADTNDKISSKKLNKSHKKNIKTQEDDLKPEDNTLNNTKTYKHYKKVDLDPDFSLYPKEPKKRKKCPKKVYAKKKTPFQPSVFMLTLSSYAEKKRQRNTTKYVYSDDSDSSAVRTRIKNSEYDNEYRPKSASDSSDENEELEFMKFTNTGRTRTKTPDLREYPMQCDHCHVEIFEKRTHYYHYLMYHPNVEYPYACKSTKLLCQFCGHVAKSKYLHEAHVLNHSSERKYICHKCPKRFKNPIRLRCHLQSVHTDKFLECDFCGKKFKTREDIQRHLRIHTGEKPFKCHICGAGFAHKGNVGIHIRSTHERQSQKPRKNKEVNGRKRRICSTTEEEDVPLIAIKNKKKKKAKTETAKKKN